MLVVEISWMSEEREEQDKEEWGKKQELDLEPPLPEPNEEQEYQLPSQQRNHDTVDLFCVCCYYKFLC
jgi:hypothetical protein